MQGCKLCSKEGSWWDLHCPLSWWWLISGGSSYKVSSMLLHYKRISRALVSRRAGYVGVHWAREWCWSSTELAGDGLRFRIEYSTFLARIWGPAGCSWKSVKHYNYACLGTFAPPNQSGQFRSYMWSIKDVSCRRRSSMPRDNQCFKGEFVIV